MKYRYELWQMAPGDENRHLRFVGLEDLLDKFGYVPDKNEYDQVWKDEIEDKYRIRAAVPILNELFDIFNLSHPEGYKGRSMSTGDVIILVDETGQRSVHFCNTFGWRELDPEKW